MPKSSYELNDIVEMKKAHACGETKFSIIRMGADIRIKCVGCGRSVMMPRSEFNKKYKKIVSRQDTSQ